MIRRDQGSHYIAEFDSLREYAEHANLAPGSNYSKRKCNYDFSGGWFEEAVDKALNGDEYNREAIFSGAKELESLIEIEGSEQVRDVAGDYFDVGEVLSGEPECWWREEPQPEKPVVRIISSISASCGVDVKTIRNKGAAVMALLDELQSLGYIVELAIDWTVDYSFPGFKKFTTLIDIPTNPLDVDGFAFLVANPMALRRLSLACLELAANKAHCGGYGSPTSYDWESEKMDAGENSLNIYFGPLFGNNKFRNMIAAKNVVLEALREVSGNDGKLNFIVI